MSTEMPLAARLRPSTINDVVGQDHLLGEGRPLRLAIEKGVLHSMIFWGPPGTGKTTLAKILAASTNARFEQISAVLAGVKEIREVIARAEQAKQLNQKTVLFVDEVHRFNKAQQDAFLPHVESGLLTFIGATTENPSFEINSALLSRTRVYVLKMLEEPDLLTIIDRAISLLEAEHDQKKVIFEAEHRLLLVQSADGDARRALNFLEMAFDFARDEKKALYIDEKVLKEVLRHSWRRFDKQGEYFYDQISALHKSVRGTDPNAALYWLSRMLDGGCDPLYVVRRVVRMATEDIGNADPRALEMALNAWDTYERLGSPEGELAIAQAVVYMACAPKSNAVYVAFGEAMADVKKYGSLEVPLHLRNAPTRLMKDLGYGRNYRYAHDEKNAYAAGENYFPEKMPKTKYYRPVSRGLELKIAEKLAQLEKMNSEIAHE